MPDFEDENPFESKGGGVPFYGLSDELGAQSTCADCGWSGPQDEMVPGYLLDEYGDIAGKKYSCPDCGHNVVETYD